MSPTEILFYFPFWKIIMIMSTTVDSSTHLEIIKVLNAQMKNFKAIGSCMVYFYMVKWMTQKHSVSPRTSETVGD